MDVLCEGMIRSRCKGEGGITRSSRTLHKSIPNSLSGRLYTICNYMQSSNPLIYDKKNIEPMLLDIPKLRVYSNSRELRTTKNTVLMLRDLLKLGVYSETLELRTTKNTELMLRDLLKLRVYSETLELRTTRNTELVFLGRFFKSCIYMYIMCCHNMTDKCLMKKGLHKLPV